MSVFVHHITVLCNNIPVVSQTRMPKDKEDALK